MPLEIRVKTVDALRGIAALSVVIYHARADYWIGVSNSWTQNGFIADPELLIGYASYPFSYGWLGVPIFFVLSGYCIHRGPAFQLQASRTADIDWRNFFIRRFLRIYPVYIAALICTVLIDSNYIKQGGDIDLANLSWRNFWTSALTMQGIFAPMLGSNTVFWTLSIEIHLYLFYPLIFAINRSHGANHSLAFAFIISAAYLAFYLIFDISQLFPEAHGGGPIFLPFVFMWAAGAYLADVEAGRASQLEGKLWHATWIGALLSGVLLHQSFGDVISAMPLAVGTVGLVQSLISIATGRPLLAKRILSPLVPIGLISYSLYATHRIAFGIVNSVGLSGQSSSIWKFILTVCFAILFARLFFLLFERPALELSRKFRTPRANLTIS